MITTILEQYNTQLANLQHLLLIINALIHLLFAGAVARDGGYILKNGQKTALVSPAIWAFSTLLGGVITAAVYWFIHHSTLTRPLSYQGKERYNERC